MGVRHNRIFLKHKLTFTLVKVRALLVCLCSENTIVSQQSELCIFQCAALAAHFFYLRKGEKNNEFQEINGGFDSHGIGGKP